MTSLMKCQLKQRIHAIMKTIKKTIYTAMTSKIISFKIIPTSAQVKLQKVDSAKFVSTIQFFEIENDK